MTNQEILKKAIKKAIKNGYYSKHWEKNIKIDNKFCDYLVNQDEYQAIIFSHDFAEAFWKNEEYINFENLDYWQYHLQQMVILPDNKKFKYLAKFLN